MVQILNQRSHTFHLGVETLSLGLFGGKFLLTSSKIVDESLLFVFEKRNSLRKVYNLNFSLVGHSVGLDSIILAIVDLAIETSDLLTGLRDVLF